MVVLALILRFLLRVLAGIALLACVLISPTPWVEALPPPGASDVLAARQFAQRASRAVLTVRKSTPLIVTKAQLDAMARVGAHGVKALRPRVRLGPQGVEMLATLVLPGEKAFLNGQFVVAPRALGVGPVQIRMGGLTLPAPVSRWLVNRTLMLALNDPAMRLETLIVLLEVHPERQWLRVRLRPQRAIFNSARERLGGLGSGVDVVAVRRAYALLTPLPPMVFTPAPGIFLKDINKVAHWALAHSPHERRAAARAAAVALALHTAGPKMDVMVGGGVIIGDQCVIERRPLLAGREDLPKHFSVSAALAVVAGNGLSLAAGESKELSDSLAGGSGFSFVDMVANRAGVRVGRALNGPSSARLLDGLQSAGMADLWPGKALLTTLPEGLPTKRFMARYGGLDDPRYVRQVAQIDALLDALPLYALAPARQG